MKKTIKTNLRMKCSSYGHWNRIRVNKIFVEQNSIERKVKVMILLYKLLEARSKQMFNQYFYSNTNQNETTYYCNFPLKKVSKSITNMNAKKR